MSDAEELLLVFQGILANHQIFTEGQPQELISDFSCPEFRELREKYHYFRRMLLGQGIFARRVYLICLMILIVMW